MISMLMTACVDPTVWRRQQQQQQLSQLLHKDGFILWKWCVYHPRLLEGIPPKDREVNLDSDHTSKKVLGLTWIPKSEQFF